MEGYVASISNLIWAINEVLEEENTSKPKHT